ncbi:MAG: hypothetical protein IPG50_15550 [Myxococcales bacterium]|nr:hypothetical protein [Myxococcales bacterium]
MTPKVQFLGSLVRWLRLTAIALSLVALLPSLVIDADCLVADALAQEPCEGDTGRDTPCACPVACGSCNSVRAVPATPTATIATDLQLRSTPAGPPIELERRPANPDPNEIGHVPRA